jgi:peptide/nickel transport system permease protein
MKGKIGRYLVQKLAYATSVMFGVIFVVFYLFQGFGDPARLVMGQTGDAATLKNIRKELGLDQPTHIQLLHYVNDLSPLCIHSQSEINEKGLNGFFFGNETMVGLKIPYLRRSYQSKRDVTSLLADALAGTILLAMAAMLLAIIIGIPLGIIAAVNRNTWIDRSAILASIAGISAPSFFMGIVIAYLFGFVLHDITGLSMTGSLYELTPFDGNRLTLQNLILPAITLGIRPLAIITQLTRSSMLDVLSQDFIRTARAKGLKEKAVIFRHALPNALNPVITAITGWFAELLAGAFFVEFIFGWKGIGKMTVDALEKLDYPVLMGSILMTATIFVLVNMLADILYAWIDPRIRKH